MALLTVYFDESGTHGESRITAIGGLMGSKEEWESVESQWLDAIDVFADVGLTWFHSSECESGDGEFEPIPVELRYAFANRLSRILASHKLLPVWSAVVNEDWREAVDDPAFLDAYPKPLHLCFSYCAQRLAEGSANLTGGSSVAVVYAEQPEYQDRFEEIWIAYKQKKRAANLRSFTIASSRDCIPLQAADLVAYEMNMDWHEREYGTPPPPLTYNIRKPLHYLREGLRVDFGGCFDAHALKVTMKRFRETGDI